jgi:hypothetical protein
MQLILTLAFPCSSTIIKGMTKSLLLPAFALLSTFLFCSCADETETKPVGPVSDTTTIPWNSQLPGQGQGQMGMMPQNQYRR